MPNRLHSIRVKEISLVKRGANRGAVVILHKSEEAMSDEKKTPIDRAIAGLRGAIAIGISGVAPDGTVLKDEAAKMAVVDAALEEVRKAFAEPVEEPAPEPEPGVEKDLDVVLKGLPPEAAVVVKALVAENAQTKAQLTEAVGKVGAMEAQEAERIAIAKAAVLMGDATAITAPELVPIVKKLDDKDLAVVGKILKSNTELVKQLRLFEAVGKPGGAASSDLSAIEARAAEIRKAEPKISKEKAFTKALEENPEAYSRYLRSQAAAQH